MSFVTLIVVNKGKLLIDKCHWRELAGKIDKVKQGISGVKKLSERTLDEGYVFIDCEKGIMLNFQAGTVLIT